MSKSKLELMIATWPERAIDLPDYGGRDTTVSYRLPLRMVDLEDKWLGDDLRAANDLGLYIWADVEGNVSIDLRAMDIYSANVRELETRLKLLKRLSSKAERAGFSFHDFKRNASLYDQIVLVLEAIGIRRAVEYRGINQPETYTLASIPAKRIADAMDAQLNRLKQRRAA